MQLTTLLGFISSGGSVMISAVNNSAGNVYVQKVTLNGKEVPMSHPFVLHSGK